VGGDGLQLPPAACVGADHAEQDEQALPDGSAADHARPLHPRVAGERRPSASAPAHDKRPPPPPPAPQPLRFPPKLVPPTPRSQERSRRLGRELFALFFPEELTASTSEAQRVATEKLSAYEQERNQQVRRRLARDVAHSLCF